MGNEYASFDPFGGTDAPAQIRHEVAALSQTTLGDMLFVGQIFRSRIRQRTNDGMDVDGAPFVPYSEKGPFYLYVNREGSGGSRSARSTAARRRASKTGGKKTPLGVKYASYGAAKAAHGRANVDLYGMEQHTHMMDTLMVQAGGIESDAASAELDFGSELSAFEQSDPYNEVTLGFYGPESERARGNDQGNSKVPMRHFFGVSQEDLDVAARAVGERMLARAKSPR